MSVAGLLGAAAKPLVGFLEWLCGWVRENRRLHDWESERDGYEQKCLGQDVFVYVAKKAGAQGEETEPRFCAHCFDHKQVRSILQYSRRDGHDVVLRCQSCQQEIRYPDPPPDWKTPITSDIGIV